MLRHLTSRVAPTSIIALGLMALAMAPAAADVVCPPDRELCVVVVVTPGTPVQPPAPGAGPSQPGSTRICRVPGTGAVFPCYDPDWGWFSNVDGCYYQLREPPPAPSETVWQGHYPDGAVYVVTCPVPLGGPGTNGGWTWLASPPDGFGAGSTTPGELAARAVDQMALTGPAIQVTVPADKAGLVGVPVWLWTEVTPTTWGPNAATAAVPGLSVTANAQATKIVWDMGDGNTVACLNAGTPYYRGAVESPTCDYIYQASSAGQPDDAYTITGTTTWEVTWTGGGTSGTLTVTRTASATVHIGELQVLVTG